MLQAFKDAAVVAQDFAAVAEQFTDVPPQLVRLGRDALCAVLHRDPVALAGVVTEADSLFQAVRADGANAGAAIAQLEADLKRFLLVIGH